MKIKTAVAGLFVAAVLAIAGCSSSGSTTTAPAASNSTVITGADTAARS